MNITKISVLGAVGALFLSGAAYAADSTAYVCQDLSSSNWSSCDASNLTGEACPAMLADDENPQGAESSLRWDCNLVVGGEVKGVTDQQKAQEIEQHYILAIDEGGLDAEKFDMPTAK